MAYLFSHEYKKERERLAAIESGLDPFYHPLPGRHRSNLWMAMPGGWGGRGLYDGVALQTCG